jgi:hypothetical protein
VVDAFVGEEPDFIEGLGNEFLLAPVDIPVVVFCLAIAPSAQGFLDAVGEEGFEFNVGAG